MELLSVLSGLSTLCHMFSRRLNVASSCKMSSSDTNRFVFDTLFESGCNTEIPGLIDRFLAALVKVKKTITNSEELTLDILMRDYDYD